MIKTTLSAIHSDTRYLIYFVPVSKDAHKHAVDAVNTAYSGPDIFKIPRTAREPAPAPKRSEQYIRSDFLLCSEKTVAIKTPAKKKGILKRRQ